MDLRSLPSVAAILESRECAALAQQFSRSLVTEAIRATLNEVRLRHRESDAPSSVPEWEQLLSEIRSHLMAASEPGIPTVVNATGIVLHTNLGRSQLNESACAALLAAATNPVALELDLQTGRRGKRDNHIRASLRALTGAEDALAVNNNAAALMLAVDTLADRREVIVSRGELIEIGGNFRLPEILRRSGAILREVGTTNRTRISDITDAMSRRTALILRAHPSNYRITGFTETPPLRELVQVARQAGIPLMEDLGSGALMDLAPAGLPDEPTVRSSIETGVDLVSFSADKLMGGPQAGLIVGKEELISRMDKNPLKRALRVDKLTLAALRATLVTLHTAEDPLPHFPMLALLQRPVETLDALARAALDLLQKNLSEDFSLKIIDSTAEVGSGAQPTLPIPSKAITVQHKIWEAEAIARFFRSAKPPILGRIRNEIFRLELHAVKSSADLLPIHSETSP